MSTTRYTVQGPDGKFHTINTCGGPVAAARMCYPGLFPHPGNIAWTELINCTIVLTLQDRFNVWRLQ